METGGAAGCFHWPRLGLPAGTAQKRFGAASSAVRNNSIETRRPPRGRRVHNDFVTGHRSPSDARIPRPACARHCRVKTQRPACQPGPRIITDLEYFGNTVSVSEPLSSGGFECAWFHRSQARHCHHVTAGNMLFEAVNRAMNWFADPYWRGPRPRPNTVFEATLAGDKCTWNQRDWFRGGSESHETLWLPTAYPATTTSMLYSRKLPCRDGNPNLSASCASMRDCSMRDRTSAWCSACAIQAFTSRSSAFACASISA